MKYHFRVGFKNPEKLSDYLGTSKDKEKDPKQKSGIYLITCQQCDAIYIGLTKRKLETRFAEHLADCDKPLNQDSAMAYHAISNGHEIDEIKLLKEVDDPWKLSAWESLELFKNREKKLTNKIKEGNSASILFEVI